MCLILVDRGARMMPKSCLVATATAAAKIIVVIYPPFTSRNPFPDYRTMIANPGSLQMISPSSV